MKSAQLQRRGPLCRVQRRISAAICIDPAHSPLAPRGRNRLLAVFPARWDPWLRTPPRSPGRPPHPGKASWPSEVTSTPRICARHTAHDAEPCGRPFIPPSLSPLLYSTLSPIYSPPSTLMRSCSPLCSSTRFFKHGFTIRLPLSPSTSPTPRPPNQILHLPTPASCSPHFPCNTRARLTHLQAGCQAAARESAPP